MTMLSFLIGSQKKAKVKLIYLKLTMVGSKDFYISKLKKV